MKRKITWRNKQHLTRLLGMAVQWDLPLSSVVNFSTGNAESKNAQRLARRGKCPHVEKAAAKISPAAASLA
ncbi:hypothetical protein [Pectobacterium carotovorum]|uniref:hypothetical protein n=1 Tax=Pectobacterium carotovorum TaxID=554 RepID=UPI0018AD2AB2|nr:hypothetical protein [Pectobacterium carotovorum]